MSTTKEEWDKFAGSVIPQLESLGYLNSEEERKLDWGNFLLFLGVILLIVGILVFLGYLGWAIQNDKFKPDINLNPSFEPNISLNVNNQQPDVTVNNNLNTTVNIPDKINVIVNNST